MKKQTEDLTDQKNQRKKGATQKTPITANFPEAAFSDPVTDPLGRPPFFIVCLGASAGGLETLEQFFSNMTPDSGMAFVVVGLPGLLVAALVTGFVLYVLYARGVFLETQKLVLIADDSEGIAVGANLTFSGFPVGRVQRIELSKNGKAKIEVEVPVESVMDWGMLGYFVGDAVQENIPVLTGEMSQPNLIRHKHFGAAAASSGGVEMYHIVGVTPEAPTLEAAFGARTARETFHYDALARRQVYDAINSRGSTPDVDFVMLGCPHYSIEQIWEVVKLLDGRKVSENCRLWIFTSRAMKTVSDRNGYTKAIRDAGGIVLTDTCSSISQSIPKGTKVAALDSAKQAHYLPAFMNIEAWFGSTADCINAACTGRWSGEAP